MEEELLMRYVEDNKQRFEVIVIPRDLSKFVVKLAHDDLGHNGSTRTYMIVRRNYYWKGLRPDVIYYVKRCTVCRKYNSASPKYNKGTFQAPGAPMDFISMDLIEEFHPPSTHGNKYVSLRLSVQNQRKKWNFPLNFCTMQNCLISIPEYSRIIDYSII